VVKVKVYNGLGDEVGQKEVEVLEHVSNQLVKDYIVAIRNNARQWSAHTQTRGEKRATSRKPRAQKGTGSSRQGDFAAPHYRGGGVCWGPRTKDIHTRINKKERQAAIRFLVGQKAVKSELIVLEDQNLEPKTNKMAEILKKIGINGRRILMLGETGKKSSASLALRNIPKTEYMPVQQINGYEILRAQKIVVLGSAFEWLSDYVGTEERSDI
jgi:large subunit ribosomal protein L4